MVYAERILPLLREAGKIILSAREVESGDQVSDKEGTANFVTVFDVTVQNFLVSELRRIFPCAEFLAEEKENDFGVLDAEQCFIIDPIDGTTNFIHAMNPSTISLALVSRGETVFGAVYNPYLDETVYAERGLGCYLNGRRVSVSSRDAAHSIAVFGTCPYYKDTLADAVFSMMHDAFLEVADIRRTGSAAYDMSLVATGRADGFFEFMLSPWDFAAGELLIREAGGYVSDAHGEPLRLDRPCSVMCGSENIYPLLSELSAKYLGNKS